MYIYIQGGPKITEYQTVGRLKYFARLTDISGWGILHPEKNYTKISHFGYVALILGLVHVSQCQVTTCYPLTVYKGFTPRICNGYNQSFRTIALSQQLSIKKSTHQNIIEWALGCIDTKGTLHLVENFILLCVISYRLSFTGFAINLSSCLETLEIGQITKMTVHNNVS